MQRIVHHLSVAKTVLHCDS
jgi:hypothetical protein